ncbi:putative emp24 gp25L p24 family GOLD [Trypanosoma vivax]|nr:putative COP-coated vesicle membrane protein erv25 precursor [Trypanosoma vivax]KAH8611113.1 putative emp24 gp25L p24 family GOLD [Trypanosoma vivax]
MCSVTRVVQLVGVFLLLVIATSTNPSSAVRFLLRNSNPVCFVEEVTEGTQSISGECTRGKAVAKPVPVVLTIKSPKNKEIYSSDILVGKQSFSAMVLMGLPGEYTICVKVKTKVWTASAEVESIMIDLDIDRNSQVLKETKPVPKRQKVNGMEVFTFRDFGGQQKDVLRPVEYFKRVEESLSKLSSSVDETKNGITYMIERFARMRYTSESTYARIWAFGALTLFVMISATWLQFRMLKSTLKQKKLV